MKHERVAALLCGGIVLLTLFVGGATAVDGSHGAVSELHQVGQNESSGTNQTSDTCTVSQNTSCSIRDSASETASSERITGSASGPTVHLVFFHSPSCPHCEDVEEHIATLREQSDVGIRVHKKRALFHEELMQQFNDEYGVPDDQHGAIPAVFFADGEFAVGSDSSISLLDQQIVQYNESGLAPPTLVQGKSIAELRSPPGLVAFLLLGVNEIATPIALGVVLIGLLQLVKGAHSSGNLRRGITVFIVSLGAISTLIGGLLAIGVFSASTISQQSNWIAIILGFMGFAEGARVLVRYLRRNSDTPEGRVIPYESLTYSAVFVGVIGGLLVGGIVATTSQTYLMASGALANSDIPTAIASLLLYNSSHLLVISVISYGILKAVAVVPDPFSSEFSYAKRVNAVALSVIGIGLLLSGLLF